MRHRLHKIMMAFAAITVLISCGGGDTFTMPRPRAYPRLAEVDSVYIAVEGMPQGFRINRSAIAETVTSPTDSLPQKGIWITVSYPQFGNARIYYTFTPVDTATYRKVIANRLERISLNFDGTPFSTTELSTPGGMEGAVFTSKEGVALPVQFLSASSSLVISGSLFLPSYAENPDSLSPAVETIKRDIIHSLSDIRGEE